MPRLDSRVTLGTQSWKLLTTSEFADTSTKKVNGNLGKEGLPNRKNRRERKSLTGSYCDECYRLGPLAPQ